MGAENKKGLDNKFQIIIKDLFDIGKVSLIGSIPFFGIELSMNRKLVSRLSSFFDSDDQLKDDINKIITNMDEVEDIYHRINSTLISRSEELQKTLQEYEKYKSLADVERKKIEPIFEELKKEGNKGIIIGLILNLLMIGLGVILSHFLRIWFPNFNF